MAIKRILVIGGTGYIGSALVKRLNDKFDLTLLIKREEPEFKYEYFICDLLDKQSLMEKVNGFDIVINLASVVRTLNKKKYQENVIGLSNLISVLEKNNIKKLIYFSTMNVNLKQKGPYSRSKSDCEELLKKSKINYIIIRPNYVYEIGKENNFFKLASVISKFNIALVIGNGENKFQPILREELVESVINIIKKFKPRSVIELNGRETISINKTIKIICGHLKKKAIVVHIPLWLANIFSFAFPFDVVGSNEDRIGKKSYNQLAFSSFYVNLKKIVSFVDNKREYIFF